MTMSDIGYEVYELRFKERGEKLPVKLANTPECLDWFKTLYPDCHIELDDEERLVYLWYGDADGEPNGMTTAEDGEEKRELMSMMTNSEVNQWHERRRAWVKSTF